MTDTRPRPRTFRTDLAEAFGEATIAIGDPPTLAFVRPPYGFTRPLIKEELGALAAGRFAVDLEAQLRACAPPSIPPLDDADRARIVRLAGEAWIALTVDLPTERDPALTTTAIDREGYRPATAAPPSVMPADSGTGTTPPDETPPVPALDMAGDPAPTEPAARITVATATSPPEVAGLPAPPSVRRALRVALTLTPEGAEGYSALIGVGADGCDPHSQALEGAGDLATILAAVPGIVAAAEDRWSGAPRYPTASPVVASATTKATPATKAAAKKPDRSTTVKAPAPAVPAAPVAKEKRQIELFG